MTQIPTAVGVYLCEQVIVEETTRHLTLVNCFTHRVVTQFPSEDLSFIVFTTLIDGLGEMPIRVSVQRLDALDDILEYSARLRFNDPLRGLRCVVRIHGLTFPTQGYYVVRVFVGGDLVGERRLHVYVKEANE